MSDSKMKKSDTFVQMHSLGKLYQKYTLKRNRLLYNIE